MENQAVPIVEGPWVLAETQRPDLLELREKNQKLIDAILPQCLPLYQIKYKRCGMRMAYAQNAGNKRVLEARVTIQLQELESEQAKVAKLEEEKRQLELKIAKLMEGEKQLEQEEMNPHKRARTEGAGPSMVI